MAIKIFKLIKSEVVNGYFIQLHMTCEKVYRVFYEQHEVINTLDKEEAEYLYALTKDGYETSTSFGKENI